MNSKQKGGAFEREICKKLSLWITHGKRNDVFWRSAMSGGRATIHGKAVRQAGDICAVAPEGHEFTDFWFIECKHVAKLDLGQFAYNNTGKLAKFWDICRKQAANHNRQPMIIAQQNRWPDPIVVAEWRRLTEAYAVRPIIRTDNCDISLLSHLLKAKYTP